MTLLPAIDRSLFESILDSLLRERGALTRAVALEAMERAASTLGKEKKPKTPRERDASPVVMTFTLRDHREWGVTEAKLEEWKEAYPAVDVPASLRLAKQWLADNPAKRPTSQMGAYLNRWLLRDNARAVERSMPRQGFVPAPRSGSAPRGEDFSKGRKK